VTQLLIEDSLRAVGLIVALGSTARRAIARKTPIFADACGPIASAVRPAPDARPLIMLAEEATVGDRRYRSFLRRIV
jgi:hypothetical protein